MTVLKLVLKLMRARKIRKIRIRRADLDDRQIKRFCEDPQYRPPENLHEGTNEFTKPIYRDVREQWLAWKFDNVVQEILDHICLDAVPSNRKRIVWRGLRNVDPDSELAIAQEGSILPDFPPTSTSSNQAIGVRFGRTGDDVEILMKITVPKGTPIIVHNALEMEVLLKQGFQLRIDRIDLDVPLHEYGKEPGIVRKVIQATVLPGEGK